MATLDKESNWLANGLKYAISLEKEACKYYQEAGQDLDDPMTGDLAEGLAASKRSNAQVIEEELANFTDQGNDYTYSGDIAVYKLEDSEDMDQPSRDDMTKLRTAYLRERNIKEFYEMLRDGSDNEQVNLLLTDLVQTSENAQSVFEDVYKDLVDDRLAIDFQEEE